MFLIEREGVCGGGRDNEMKIGRRKQGAPTIDSFVFPLSSPFSFFFPFIFLFFHFLSISVSFPFLLFIISLVFFRTP